MKQDTEVIFSAVCLPTDSFFMRLKSIVWHRCCGRVVSYAHIVSSERCVQSYSLYHHVADRAMLRRVLFYDVFCSYPYQISLRNLLARGQWKIRHGIADDEEVKSLLFDRSVWICCIECDEKQCILLGVGKVIVHERIFDHAMTEDDLYASLMWLRKRVLRLILRVKRAESDTATANNSVFTGGITLLFVQEKLASALCSVFADSSSIDVVILKDMDVASYLQFRTKRKRSNGWRVLERYAYYLSMIVVVLCGAYSFLSGYKCLCSYFDYVDSLRQVQGLNETRIQQYRDFISKSEHPAILLKKTSICVNQLSAITRIVYESGTWRIDNA